jgi:hypothetical protein
VHFPRTERLDVWCAANGVEEAVVAGFFLRDPYGPLGELWMDGRPMPHEPVAEPFGRRRSSCRPDPLKVGEAMPLMSDIRGNGREEREIGMSSKKARRVTGLPS